MSGSRCVGVVVAGALAFAGCARKSPEPSPPEASVRIDAEKGSLGASGLVTESAVVEAIDQKSRMVTLKKADGQRLRFKVSDEVRNLAQVKKGDQVNVSYYESVLLQLHKPGEATTGVTVAEQAERAKPGELPAAAVAEVVTVTSKVVEVDRSARTVTLELPSKEKLAVKVNDRKRLEHVKVGDLVEATYREGIAVAVERPTAP